MDRRASIVACALAALVVTMAVRAEARETLAQARELYASAAYNEALTVLNGLLAAERPREERQTVELYRVLCLVALGRRTEADTAIEAMVAQDPLYRPSADDLSPRMRSVFSDARKRMLPSIVQVKYTEAKAAFDRKDFAAAVKGFRQVLDVLSDPDVGPAASQPPLSDLRMLADGFQDLSARAVEPLRPAVVVDAPKPPVPGRIYTVADRGVVPPVVILQRIPPLRGKVTNTGQGVVEVIIGVNGAVESARMAVPLTGMYDGLVVSAAKSWRYEPATMNGVPVRFRKLVQVTLSPTSPAR